MKKLVLIFSLALACVACQEDMDSGSTKFGISTTEMNVGAEASDEVVKLMSGGNNWAATSDSNWILVSPVNGNSDTNCDIAVKTTQQDEMRTGFVTFTNLKTLESVNLKVVQGGFAKEIKVDEGKEAITLPNYAVVTERYVDVEVTANVNFDVELEPASVGWVQAIAPDMELTTGYIPRTKTLRINWNINTNPEADRKVKLNLVPRDGEEIINEASIDITQAKGDLIEDSRAGDSLALNAIARNINLWYRWPQSSPMSQWEGVSLWTSKTVAEEGMPQEAIGRVRSARFYLMDTKEPIPYEVRYLKYAESLNFSSNANQTLKKGLTTGTSLSHLEYLKSLTVMAYGLESVDESLKDAKNLETLVLQFNNFTKFPEMITPENFPNLKHLTVAGNQIGFAADLSQVTDDFEGGLMIDMKDVAYLFAWDNLETLHIGNNFIHGSIPTEEEIEAIHGTYNKYTNEYFAQKFEEDKEKYNYDDDKVYDPKTYEYAYTGKYYTKAADGLVVENSNGTGALKMILPNVKTLRLNLNRLTGEIPSWVLDHPSLMYFDPFTLIFNQDGATKEGIRSGFDNEPVNFDFYYQKYPLLRQAEEEFFDDEEDDQLLP